MLHKSEIHLRTFSVSISIERRVIYDIPDVNRQQMASLPHCPSISPAIRLISLVDVLRLVIRAVVSFTLDSKVSPARIVPTLSVPTS